MNTIGSRIAENRRRIGMTQEELAAKLAVSAQAVSKWENDITCPDVMTLPKLAELLGITVDELLSGKKQPQTLVLADEERKSVDDMMLKIIVNSHEGDKVKVNLPIPLVKGADCASAWECLRSRAMLRLKASISESLSRLSTAVLSERLLKSNPQTGISLK